MVRMKYRYFLVELVWEGQHTDPTLNFHKIKDEIIQSIQQNFGDLGIGLLSDSFKVCSVSPATNKFIIRCARLQYQRCWQAMTLIRKFSEQPCILRVLHVGGTIRTCQSASLDHDRKMLLALKGTFPSLRGDDDDGGPMLTLADS
ncbi:putative Rpp14 family protein [Paratrimastix pyriformis]|uniref:Ribonuclease P/MRP protein subunit POP5 n=1 Tax=Paratrimastix pyriformis TaxID=342808 RepID=A0ABQ8U9F4_9EUKA|nr:putative Rpp14 family protein [Paratrimastix pyriformis]